MGISLGWGMVIEEKKRKPETLTPQILTHHGILTQWNNTRGINNRTKQMTHLPQSHMSVRPRHRRWEIHISHFLPWKSQSHYFLIPLASTTDAPSKVLGKLTISSPVHLQPLKIIITSRSHITRPLYTLIYHDRVVTIELPGQGPSSFL